MLTKLAGLAIVIAASLPLSPPTDAHLCENPAYAHMHEEVCGQESPFPFGGGDGGGRGGLGGLLHRLTGGLL